jgi:pilus assembly protein CpaD
MLKINGKTATAKLGSVLALCSSVLLTACNMSDAELENNPNSVAHYDRYPIRVEKAPVKIGVSGNAGTLRPEQIDAVVNFAQDARTNADSKIAIKWPAGSRQSRQVAADIARLMVDEGVPEAMIVPASYPGSASSPVQISYLRKVAVTKECGDWSDNIASNQANTPYRNYGCAVQNNIAAMVANPEDFERPRAMSPANATDRTAVIAIYYVPKANIVSSSSN